MLANFEIGLYNLYYELEVHKYFWNKQFNIAISQVFNQLILNLNLNLKLNFNQSFNRSFDRIYNFKFNV